MRYNLAPLTRLAHEVSLVDSDYHDWSVWKHDFSDEVGVLQESLKKSCLTQLQLVTLFILLNEYSEFNFKRVVKLSDTLKVSLGKLSSFSTI
jgi:hypothetical protein